MCGKSPRSVRNSSIAAPHRRPLRSLLAQVRAWFREILPQDPWRRRSARCVRAAGIPGGGRRHPGDPGAGHGVPGRDRDQPGSPGSRPRGLRGHLGHDQLGAAGGHGSGRGAHPGARRARRDPPRRGPESEETPVVLPHAVITVTETGVLDVTVDGTDVPQPEDEAWTRSTFGPLLDVLTRDRTITVRIEVHESYGSVFTDVIRARRRTTPEPPEPEPEDQRGKRVKSNTKRRPDLVEATGEGFV